MRQLLSLINRWRGVFKERPDPIEENVGEDVRPHWVMSDEDKYNRSQKESERFDF